MSRVWPTHVPGVARDSLTAPGYLDAFQADVARVAPRTAEAWARSTFETAPSLVRGFLLAGWRVGLGLRLGPRHAPDHVLGWRIAERTPTSVTLELSSCSMTCHLLFLTDADRLLFCTSIRFERKVGALLWAPASLIHRQVIPAALGRAVRRVEAGTAES